MAIQINGKKVIQLGTANIPLLKGEKGDIGQQGEQGIQGIPGYTPVKGIDYMTSEDKQQIADTVKTDITPEITELKNGKVDKKEGYGLSQNDFTNELKDKLDKLNTQDDKVVKGHYDEENKQIILELQSGNKIAIPVNDLLDDFYVKQTIDNLLKEQQEQLDILNSEIESNTLSGESVVVADGVTKTKISSIVNGNSYQETTEGYQLLDIENFSYNTNVNKVEVTPKYVILEQIDMNKNAIIRIGSMNLKAGVTYTIKRIIERLSGSATENDIGNIELYLGTTWKKILISPNVTTPKTFTVDEDGIYVLSLKLAQKNVETFTDKIKLKFSELMVYEGTDDKPYEPYTNGASPNTEYEQDIEVIEAYNEFNKDNFNKVNMMTQSSSSTIVNSSSNRMLVLPCKPNTTYTIKKISSKYFTACFINQEVTSGVAFQNYVNGGTGTEIQATSSSDSKYLCVWYYNTGDTVTEQEILDSLLIYKGTKDLPYLPYGHIGLVQRGKNRLPLPNQEISKTVNGITFTDNGDGTITANGTATAKTTLYFYKGNNEKYKKGTYTSSSNLNSFSGVRFGLEILVNSQTLYYNTTSFRTDKFDSDFQIKTANYQIDSGITVNNLTLKPMLEENTVATEFEPYIEPKTTPINLNGNTLAKVGDIKDLLNIGVDGSVKIGDKVIKKYVFTGDETFGTNTANGYQRFYIIMSDIKYDSSLTNRSSEIMSNYFKTSIIDGYSICYRYQNQILFYTDGVITTVEDFKAWVKEKYDSGNPLYIDYVLEEPIAIDLPSIEPIELFEGTNIFELVTNLGTTMAVTYKVSNKKQIKNLQAQIDKINSAIVALGAV